MVPQCTTYAAGTDVFVRVSGQWLKAQVTSTDLEGEVTVHTEQGQQVCCAADQCFLQNVDAHDEEVRVCAACIRCSMCSAQQRSRACHVQDMTRLAHLHEPGVLFNLETRYLDSNIYTFTGNILIAINPFAQLPGLYGPSVMERYKGKDLHQLPPHIYATVAAAYRQMLSEQKGQAILVRP
jgi:myosin heavy subunit